jgi:DNA-binding response OmpR family regulator
MKQRPPIQILLQGEPASSAESLRKALRQAEPRFAMTHAPDLGEGLKRLQEAAVDLVLLDLHVQEGGLHGLVRIHEHAPDVPVVVLAGGSHETLARKAVEIGAQDYLRKENLSPDLLVRSIRYALERARLLTALHGGGDSAPRTWSPTDRSGTAVTAGLYGSDPLRNALPDVFAELQDEYAATLDLAQEQLTYMVDHSVAERLRRVAGRLGFLKAGPRDVVELHYAVLKQKSANTPAPKLHAYLDEARVRLLELMGDLVSYYRAQSLGAWPRTRGERG